MNLDDVVYVICLLVCIIAGIFVRRLKANRNECTALGCLMVLIVSGGHSLHCLVSYFLGAAAVIYVHPSKCHVVTFFVMFGYLTFFRLCYIFGLPDVPGHTNMIQMILTLKVAGVAFEKNNAWKKIRAHEQQIAEKKTKTTDEPPIDIVEFDREMQDISFTDIFHYTFSYIGVLTGPYYRYRTHRDYYHYPFRYYAPCSDVTLKKLMYAVFYCALYLAANYMWPLGYALTDEFKFERSFFYRLMYVWPTFFIFRMRMYTGLTLSECVCTMAGFGAYPEEAKTTNGDGPALTEYDHLKQDVEKHKYDFTTIVNTRVWGVETCYTFREGMKHWNICVQYWMAVNIYKKFRGKIRRTILTLLVSAYWHGFRPGHYFCIMGAPFYLIVEDMWYNLLRKDATGLKRSILDILTWIMKFFAFSYLGTAFLLVSFENIWHYYNTVYHFGYIAWLVSFAVASILLRQKENAKKRKKRLEASENNETDAHLNKPKTQ